MQSSIISSPAKKRCNNCQQSCVDVCDLVKAKHKNLITQLHVFHKLEAAKAYGNPCENIQTEGIENLFVEPQMTQAVKQTLMQKKTSTLFTATELSSEVSTTKELTIQYADIDRLLQELEKDVSQPIVKKLTLADHAKELTTLIRRAGSQTLSLLNPQSTETDINNLDATCNQLAEKNNILPDLISSATITEKNNPEFLRLSGLVTQAVESAKRLGQKEPLIKFQDDFTHPFNGYRNEIQMLQHLLSQNK